jgi:ribosomal protein L35
MLKTNKAVIKRIKISKKGKIQRRPLGQNHCKAKLSGRQNQEKRRLLGFVKVDEKKLKKYTPYI